MWRSLSDPHNPENRNAGNGGDLIKHTIYLATLSCLLDRPPWRQQLRLRECHAGRGMYRLPEAAPRTALVRALLQDPVGARQALLHEAQRDALDALGARPAPGEQPQWYAGSGLLDALLLARHAERQAHRVHAYEWHPATRRILAAVHAAAPLSELAQCDLGAATPAGHVDGEEHIARHIASWGQRDVVLLDPFGIWRKRKHAQRRERYRRIVDALIARGDEAPPVVWFWTWSADVVARADLDGTAAEVEGGYGQLRGLLARGGRRIVRVTWRWGQWFAMWVLAPATVLSALRDTLQSHCHSLVAHVAHVDQPDELDVTLCD